MRMNSVGNKPVPTAAESHLTLADWCLRYKLVEEAHGAQTRPIARCRTTPASTPRAPSAPQPNGDRTSNPRRRKSSKRARSSSKRAAAPTPDLPNGAVEMFTRKVQPILVNNCTTSKCHQPNGQQAFQLNRASLRGEANRKTTMQNLAAALALVDRQHPEQSQLLTIPRQTHGGMHAPTFGPRQDQAFRHLADWVALLAPPAPPAETQTNTTTEPATLLPSQTTALGPVPRLNEAAKPQPRGCNRASPDRVAANAASPALWPQSRAGNLKDPFDPEIFNRRRRRSPGAANERRTARRTAKRNQRWYARVLLLARCESPVLDGPAHLGFRYRGIRRTAAAATASAAGRRLLPPPLSQLEQPVLQPPL